MSCSVFVRLLIIKCQFNLFINQQDYSDKEKYTLSNVLKMSESEDTLRHRTRFFMQVLNLTLYVQQTQSGLATLVRHWLWIHNFSWLYVIVCMFACRNEFWSSMHFLARREKHCKYSSHSLFSYFFDRSVLMFANCYEMLIGLKPKRLQETHKERICSFTTSGQCALK